MGAGSGGTDAIRMMAKMIRDQRRQRRERQERRERRKRRKARHRASANREWKRGDSTRPSFHCMYLCSRCHFMVENAVGPCPACGEESWIDLGGHLHLQRLREEEEAKRAQIPLAPRAATALLAALGTVCVALCGESWWVVGVVWLVVVLLLFIFAVPPATSWLLRRRDRLPLRWRGPAPLPRPRARPVEHLSGTVEPISRTRRAPFSGRPALACEASILFFANDDVHPPRWVSREIDACDIALAGRRIPSERVVPLAPQQLVDERLLQDDGTTLDQILRARGLSAADGRFELYEAIIAPGDDVDAAIYSDPPTALVVRAEGASELAPNSPPLAFDRKSRRALRRLLADCQHQWRAARRAPVNKLAVAEVVVGVSILVGALVLVAMALMGEDFVGSFGPRSVLPDWTLGVTLGACVTGFPLLLVGLRRLRDRRVLMQDRGEAEVPAIEPFVGSCDAGALSLPSQEPRGALSLERYDGGGLELAQDEEARQAASKDRSSDPT